MFQTPTTDIDGLVKKTKQKKDRKKEYIKTE